MSKFLCGNYTKNVRDFRLDAGGLVTLNVAFYYEAGDQGQISGPYDRAVEPVSDYYEITSLSLENGAEYFLSDDEQERLIEGLAKEV